MDWYRAYHGMPQDTKLKVVARRSGQPMERVLAIWLCLLDMASQNDPRGMVRFDVEELAVMQDIENVDDVKAIINAFYEKNMLTPEGQIVAWHKRQYTSPTERSKKFRAKKQRNETRGNTAKHDATPSNAGKRKITQKVTDREEDSDSRAEEDSEQKKDSDKNLQTREEKGERERGKHRTSGNAAGESQSENQILEQMLEIWNAEVQSKLTRGHNAKLTGQRKELLGKRWAEDFQQDIRAWRYYCQVIGSRDFCLGKIEGKDWTIDLSWAIASSDHIAKVLEGGFSGGKHPPKPPACEVPALQAAWDAALAAFEKKHSKATCRSWLSNTALTQMDTYRDGAVVIMRCSSKFVAEWLTQHFLTDLTASLAQAAQPEIRVMRIELITEGGQ